MGRLSSRIGFFGLFLLFGCNEERAPAFEAPPTALDVPNPEVPHERLPEQASSFREIRCIYPVTDRVTQCGLVTVPEGPGSEREIELNVVRIFSTSDAPKTDPVVYLEGGPGAGSVANAERLYDAFASFAPDRDFIFFDQRGTGSSLPGLYCADLGDLEEALDSCFSELSQESDLNQYNTINNATDTDLIREAFGYEEWNLLGISYGTRLALTAMRDHPGGIRSVILDSVVPLEGDLLGEVGISAYRSLEKVFAACASQEDCAAKYPDPLEQLTTLVTTLNADPVDVSIEDADGNDTGESFVLDGDLFAFMVFNLLYSPQAIVLIPLLIDRVSGGEYSLLSSLAPSALGPSIAFGMHLSFHCSEELPFSSQEQYEQFDSEVPEAIRAPLSGMEYWDYCDHWPVDAAPASEGEPVVSDVRTLILSGSFDPITPPHFAETAYESLTNAEYFELEGESHGASVGSCGTTLVKSFLDDPNGNLPVSCLGNVGDFTFANQGARAGAPKPQPVRFLTVSPDGETVSGVVEDLERRLR